MNWSQVWALSAALLFGVSAGWVGRRSYSMAEVRKLLDRLLLLENELRSARAALVRERQLRLGSQAALRQAEVDRDSWMAQARGEADSMSGGELEELMIEVVEEAPQTLPESAQRFTSFERSAYSEPPPRMSDVRELRRPRSSEEITRRAYELWDAAGRPEGQDEHFWFMAEDSLRREEREVEAGRAAEAKLHEDWQKAVG